MAVKLKVDSEACVGCGLCVGSFPNTFDFNEDGKAVVKGDIEDANADDAVANCPAAAISK